MAMACLRFVALSAVLLPRHHILASSLGVELFSDSLGSSPGLGEIPTFLQHPRSLHDSHAEGLGLWKRNVLNRHSKRAQKRSLIQYLSIEGSSQQVAQTQIAAATTTAAPTTTTTTVDPAVIQAKIKNVSDTELLAEIAAEETRMQGMLLDIGKSLNLTQKRAERALMYANWTVLNSTDTKTRATQANAAAMTNNDTMKMLLKEFPKLNASLVKANTKIKDTNASIAKMEKDMGDAAKEKTAMKRAVDAEDVLKLLAPRIDGIEEHQGKIEQIVHFGNFTHVIDDEINKDIQISLDNIEDTFASQIEANR